jgi:glycosyltransferase involved in cell wall biosynthesis
MKVLVDPAAFRFGRCGVSRYWAAVCTGLRQAGISVDLPLVASGSDYMRGMLPLDPMHAFPGSLDRLRGQLLRVSGELSRRLFLRKLATGHYDVVLPTAVRPDTAVIEAASRVPVALVCHDTMRSMIVPGGAADAWSDPLHRLLALARRSARILCVSERTRRDLETCIPAVEGRTRVVRTGNLLPLWAEDGARVPNLPEGFLLFVGGRQVRKNFVGLVHALAPLLRQAGSPALVCTGDFSRWEKDFLDAHGVASRVVGMDATDRQLVTLYQKAIALLFPSVYEGFGMPVLEAMALGCPVITSANASLPEVAGDAALYVDTSRPEDMRAAVERVLRQPELRATIAQAGRAHAAGFTFEGMMKGIVQVLMEATQVGPAAL